MRFHRPVPTALITTLLALAGACTEDRPYRVEEPVRSSPPAAPRADDFMKQDGRAGAALEAADMAAPPPAEPSMPMTPMPAPKAETARDGERYRAIEQSSFLDAAATPLSTFSIDVDTASYALIRSYLNGGHLPPEGAVRVEEMLNYFDYAYTPPRDDRPFAIHTAVAAAPWAEDHRIVRIGIKGKEIPRQELPSANLVFLIDVSGSMDEPDKLPLLKRSLGLLVAKLRREDSVGIVVYAGASGVVLSPTTDKDAMTDALSRLSAGGSTNGAAGIQLAYKLARENFQRKGINRVILATDGDFNVGVSSESELVKLITKEAADGVFLSVLGFGQGNYNDSAMEQLADKGNGNYAYIDTLDEGRKVLQDQLSGTLATIAKDVKIQVEFNPALVKSYRLIGYENRALASEDFNDDKKDAGEIGAGHTVTALYEVVPVGARGGHANVDPLKYQKKAVRAAGAAGGELMTVKVRYKEPDGDSSKLLTRVVEDSASSLDRADPDFRFAAAVAGFGMKLRADKQRALDYGEILSLAKSGLGDDGRGLRAEFVSLVRKAEGLTGH